MAEDRKGLTTSSGRDSPVSSADDTAVEASLRQAFAESAPETLPTIGVRERIVERLRVRRRRRQRVVISVAGSCVLVVGVLVGALAVHPSGPSSRESAAPSMASAGAGARSVSKASGGAPKSLSVNCPSVFVGPPSGARRCFGTFSDPATAYDSPVFSPEASGTAVFGSSREANGADKLNTQKAGGAGGTTGSPLLAAPISPASPAIVVPVGRTVTIDLRGDVREFWTAPAVAPGQGTTASGVRQLSASVGKPGGISATTFRSAQPVTVVVIATELSVCGNSETVCGSPTREWSVVLEFQKT